MNKVKFLLPFLLLCAGMIHAQNFQWAKRLSGSGSFDVNVKKVAATSSDGLFVCGSFTGTVDFEPGSPVVNKTANGTDGFVAKYDEGGNLLWVFTTDSAGTEEISCITSTATRVTAVEKKGTNSFRVRQLNSATGAPTVQSSYFISYNATVTPEAVTINAVNSSICLVGSLDGWLLVGTYTYGSAGLSDMFYMNLGVNANGIGVNTFVTYGASGNDFGHDIVSLPSGLMYIAGSLSGTVSLLDAQNVAFSVTSAGGTDAVLMAIDISGDIPKADNLMRIGSTGDDEFLSVTAGTNSTNELAVGGYFTGTVDFNAKSPVNSLISAGGKDGCVAKYTYTNQAGGSAFDYGWANKLGGTADDRAIAVSQFATTGNVYFSAALGSSTGTAVQLGAYTSTGTNATFGGLFLPANQTTVNVPRSIRALSTGEVYTTGIFNASTDFDPSNGTFTIAPVSGGNNGFIHKMSNCTPAAAPVISASRDTVCTGFNDTLRVTGALGGNNKWVWYSGTCGSTFVDTGAVIVVAPTANTTYYVRGEGGCAANGTCSAAKTIVVRALPPAPVVTATGPATVC
ncbi:MAG TPA: hypothetical protein PLW44_02350, partial [Chitinophagales bacterium]|nr:hypothetical protein [Chitinophagales bacterium]